MKHPDLRRLRRDIVEVLQWRPRLINGIWDGQSMWDRFRRSFTLPPEFRLPAQELFAEGFWGVLRGVYPRWGADMTRPNHPDRSAKENRAIREKIIQLQLLPFIDPESGEWDGKTVIDPAGKREVLPRPLRFQMQFMALEGYYGNVAWADRRFQDRMRDFGAEGRLRHWMTVSAIRSAMDRAGEDYRITGRGPEVAVVVRGREFRRESDSDAGLPERNSSGENGE